MRPIDASRVEIVGASFLFQSILSVTILFLFFSFFPSLSHVGIIANMMLYLAVMALFHTHFFFFFFFPSIMITTRSFALHYLFSLFAVECVEFLWVQVTSFLLTSS